MRLPTRLVTLFASTLVAVTAASAQVTLFSTGVGPFSGGFNGGAYGPVMPIAVSATTTISQFGFWGSLTSATNVKFFIFDMTTNTKVFEQEKAFAVTPDNTLMLSDPFTLLLTGGRTYNFGVIAELQNSQFVTFFSSLSPVVTQGAFSNPGGNTNYGPYANPQEANQGGGARIAIEIRGPSADTNVVPEPATVVLMLTGMAGLLAASRRRSRTTD